MLYIKTIKFIIRTLNYKGYLINRCYTLKQLNSVLCIKSKLIFL